MITHYRTFEVNGSSDIPDCETVPTAKIAVCGAFENESSAWVEVQGIAIVVYKQVSGRWDYYGVVEWTGSCALKPGQIYDAGSNEFSLPVGVYSVSDFRFQIADGQSSGIYYCPDPFKLTFSR